MREVAAARQVSPAAVSLAWLLARPEVTSVIFGARTVEQVEANLAAAELALTGDEVARLDEASSFALGYPYDFMGRVQGRW